MMCNDYGDHYSKIQSNLIQFVWINNCHNRFTTVTSNSSCMMSIYRLKTKIHTDICWYVKYILYYTTRINKT